MESIYDKKFNNGNVEYNNKIRPESSNYIPRKNSGNNENNKNGQFKKIKIGKNQNSNQKTGNNNIQNNLNTNTLRKDSQKSSKRTMSVENNSK